MYKTISVLVVSTCVASQLLAHGVPIDIVNVDGQLAPFSDPLGIPVFEPGELEVLGDSIATDSPGFGISNQANGIEVNTRINLEVTSELFYWDGQSVSSPDQTELIILSPDSGQSYAVSAQSTDHEGMHWATYPGGNFWDADGIYFLEPISSPRGIYGFEIQLSSPSYQTSEPFLLPFIFGQMSGPQIEEGISALRDILKSEVQGDFNQDTVWDSTDLDQLTIAVLDHSNDLRFDLTGDGKVTADDRTYWIEVIKNTFPGDSDLDGEFSSSDLVVVFQAGKYEDNISLNSTWSDGDWNGDLEFNTNDFVTAFQAGGFENGPRTRTVLVPEPKFKLIASSLFVLILFRRSSTVRN